MGKELQNIHNKANLADLKDIKTRLENIVSDAKRIVRRLEPDLRKRAEVYWLPTIEGCIGKDGDALAATMCTLDETIEEVQERVDDTDEE
jgi:hypothetical protein